MDQGWRRCDDESNGDGSRDVPGQFLPVPSVSSCQRAGPASRGLLDQFYGKEHAMPHHSEGDQLRSTRRIWLITTLITLAVSLLSTVLWTLPNWALFSKNVSHFPALWQFESNRSVIIILVIKVIAPLLIAPLVFIGSWLFLTLRLILSEELSGKQRAPAPTRQTRQSSPGRSRMVRGIRRAISPPLPGRGSAAEAPPPLPGRSTPLSPQQAQHPSPRQPVVSPGQTPSEPRLAPLLPTLPPHSQHRRGLPLPIESSWGTCRNQNSRPLSRRFTVPSSLNYPDQAHPPKAPRFLSPFLSLLFRVLTFRLISYLRLSRTGKVSTSGSGC